jgi:hypothetical protein
MEQFRTDIIQMQYRLLNFYEQLQQVSSRDLYYLLTVYWDEFRNMQRTFNNITEFISKKFPKEESLPIYTQTADSSR